MTSKIRRIFCCVAASRGDGFVDLGFKYNASIVLMDISVFEFEANIFIEQEENGKGKLSQVAIVILSSHGLLQAELSSLICL